MALTKNDLAKIKKVIREEVKTEVKDSSRTLSGQIRMSRMQIQQDISELDDRMKNVEIRVDGMDSKVDNLNSKIDKNHKEVLKKLKVVSHTLDKQTMEVAKRVGKIEDHLSLPQN